MVLVEHRASSSSTNTATTRLFTSSPTVSDCLAEEAKIEQLVFGAAGATTPLMIRPEHLEVLDLVSVGGDSSTVSSPRGAGGGGAVDAASEGEGFVEPGSSVFVVVSDVDVIGSPMRMALALTFGLCPSRVSFLALVVCCGVVVWRVVLLGWIRCPAFLSNWLICS